MYIMSAVSLASMAPCNIMYVYMYIMVPSCFAGRFQRCWWVVLGWHVVRQQTYFRYVWDDHMVTVNRTHHFKILNCYIIFSSELTR